MCRPGWLCRAALLLAISSLSLPLSAHAQQLPAAQEQPPRDGQRAAPTGSARISGRVVARDTGRGVSRAHGAWSTTRASLSRGAADITDATVEFRGGDDRSSLLVTMTDRVTALRGDVSDDTGRPVRDYTVLVFPEAGSPPARLRWHNNTTPDQAGRYELRGLPPGRYVAAAVEDIEPGAENDPELHERLRPLGTAFVLGEGEQKVLRLRVAALE
jgi:hypothetical protein